MTEAVLTLKILILQYQTKKNDYTQKHFCCVQSFGKGVEIWNLIYRYHWKNTDMKIFG
jgi:hypothetical protein